MRLRPHHGLCAQSFEGKGYSDAFTANMARILKSLDMSPEQEIILSVAPDDICKSCPRMEGNRCESEAHIEAIDRRCLTACGLTEGTRLTWRDYREMARTILKLHGPETLCGDCQWMHICAKVR